MACVFHLRILSLSREAYAFPLVFSHVIDVDRVIYFPLSMSDITSARKSSLVAQNNRG